MGGGGISQLLSFGVILDGSTLFRNVKRIGRATRLRLRFDGARWKETAELYYEPEIAASVYPGIEEDIVSSFSRAVESIHHRTEGMLISAISGGMDSRCIVAALHAHNANVPLVTHYTREGHDFAIASRIAKRLGFPHHTYRIETSQFLDREEETLVRLSNGMATFDNLHVPQVYRFYRKLGTWMLDGNHTFIEGRIFLRNATVRIRTRDDMFREIRAVLSKMSVLNYVHDAEQHRSHAEEILWERTPDPRQHGSPGSAADIFHVRHILPQHGSDASALHNHYLRYTSPYFDRRYVDTVSRLPDLERWKQRPQHTIVQNLAPVLRGVPRSYSDILTWPTDNPWLLRIPVAMEYGCRKLKLHRRPWLFRHLTRYSPTVKYSLDINTEKLLARAEGTVFDTDKLRAAINTTGVPDAALSRILPLLSSHSPWNEQPSH